MLESIVKDVASLLPSVKPKEIILSGRFTRYQNLIQHLICNFQVSLQKRA